MYKRWASLLGFLLCPLLSCTRPEPAGFLTMTIESSPTNLDPRIGTDAQAERIDELLFDSLVRRDEHFELKPFLAESWTVPDPRTYVFHLRHGVRFTNGQDLTSRDVKWTLDSMANGTIVSAKTSTYKPIDQVEAPDPYTVVLHLKGPFAALLWNLSDGAIGIVPYGSGKDFSLHPVGSGPFKLVSMQRDDSVVLSRNQDYWDGAPRIEGVRFTVVPDATTRALELRKGSADVAVNAVSPDTVMTLQNDRRLAVERQPGTNISYLAFNLRDPILKDVRVRQAIAYAVDREPLMHSLWRDTVRPANSVLPPQHWAFTSDVVTYPHDPAKASALLEAAGYPMQSDGYRLRLTMKTSTDETSRLLAAVLQQQLRPAGIRLEIASYEFATFYADVVKGAFQIYTLRWVGGNEDPDIFEFAFDSASFPPRRANRSYYSNPEVDSLIEQAKGETDMAKRRDAYVRIQQILARDLPYLDLWYVDNVLIHGPRMMDVPLDPSGNYEFLKTAELVR